MLLAMLRSIVLLIALSVPAAVLAQDAAKLDRPGMTALMRHALAPGTGDPAGFRLEDCGTQRGLDDRGRDQARRTGAALRAAGVVFDAIWTSQWCRARDTATLLGLGPVTEVPALNSHFAGRGDRAAQTAEVRKMLAALAPDARVLLVSHQVNIRALTGRGTRSGEVLAATRDANGVLTVTGSFTVAP